MKTFKGSNNFPANAKNPVVALGNFDGVHKAHQKMFKVAQKLAAKLKGQSVVYTFDPHPVKVLSQASAPPLINTLEQRLELIKDVGIDRVVIEPFLTKFAHMEAAEWFEKILVKRLHAKGVVAGYDFTFGSHRSGTAETLQSLCQDHNITCKILKAQLFRETLISSTQIRQFVSRGDVRHAKELLGRPFYIDGKVVEGKGRGVTLGIRTANLKTDNELLPKEGVYACQARIGRKTYCAVTNIGMNPTFGGETLSIEAHLLDFNKDIYNKALRLYFLDRIRDERPFASPEELVQQIQKDIKAAKKIFPK